MEYTHGVVFTPLTTALYNGTHTWCSVYPSDNSTTIEHTHGVVFTPMTTALQ